MPSEPYKLPLKRVVRRNASDGYDVVDANGKEVFDDGSAYGEYGQMCSPEAADALVHAANTLPNALRLIGELRGALESAYSEGYVNCTRSNEGSTIAARLDAKDSWRLSDARAAADKADKFLSEGATDAQA